MAFYKQDIVDVNLETGVIHRSFLNHTIGHKDDDADRFGIRAFRNGEPVDLSGAQCQAVFMAPDGTNIALTSYGTVSGNEAYVTLPQACYNVEGQFCLAIKLVGSGVTATVRIIDGVVDRTGATGAVAPTEAVPTYQEILAVYAEMQEDVADYESVVATQNGKIDDLNNVITAAEDVITEFDGTLTWVAGKYIDARDGGIYSSNSYSYTELTIAKENVISIVTYISSYIGIAFYDSNGTMLSSVTNTEGTTPYNKTLVIPRGATLVRITCLTNQHTHASVKTTLDKEVTYLSDAVYGLSDNKVDKSGIKQVTTKNAEFMFYSPNLFNVNTRTDGYIVNQVTGELNESSTNSVSDWIPVEPLTNYVFSYTGSKQLRYCFYNGSKTFISGVLSDNTPNYISITTPANTQWLRFSTTLIMQANMQFEQGTTPTEYSPYGESYLLPLYAPQEKPILNLPSKIYATSGIELNIYFENIVEDWTKYDWNISCFKGSQYARGFHYVPTDSDAGTVDLLIIAQAGYMQVSKKVSLITTASTAGSGVTKSVIVLGDSTTANGIAVEKLHEDFSGSVMSVETRGTMGTAPNNHEGRSGWTFSDYFTRAADPAYPSILNPFYNPSSETFDADYYFANSGVSVPDWFFINLGINDMFGYTTDSALETAIETVIGLCDDMIDSILTAEPTIKIGLCLTIPPNHSQDAFGKAYGTGQTRDRYKRNNLLWVNSMIAEYDGRESENLYLVPIYTNLDTVWNMGMELIPVNARNTTTYESPIGNGGVHPADSGYWQIADVYTAFLKAQAAN